MDSDLDSAFVGKPPVSGTYSPINYQYDGDDDQVDEKGLESSSYSPLPQSERQPPRKSDARPLSMPSMSPVKVGHLPRPVQQPRSLSTSNVLAAQTPAPDAAAGYRRRRDMATLIGTQKHMAWNEKYQLLMESIPQGFVASAEEFNRTRSFVQDLLTISKDFVNLAAMYGKIIMSEKELNLEDKTIKPAALGGVGSGTKYLQRGILFKFPQVDEYGIYNGDDESAAKAGGHELKGLMGFKTAGIKELHLPLMALIDYRGYRLIAVSTVPITKDTLVYGSRDGGHRVVNTDPRAAALMGTFGRFMLLKAHKAGFTSEQEVFGPADIEVHKGLDGRYYVVDFARVFPPEAPSNPGDQHVYKLRPEFVRNWPHPLSSDAFSNMEAESAESKKSEEEVRQATHHLLHNLIPEFVMKFERYLGSGGADAFKESSTSPTSRAEKPISIFLFKKAHNSLIEETHRAGISILPFPIVISPLFVIDAFTPFCTYALSANISSSPDIRHLGRINSRATCREFKMAIIIEMSARCVKLNLKRRWRQHTEKHPAAEDESYKRVTARYLNLVMGRSDKTALHWTFELIPQIIEKFADALSDHERAQLSKLATTDHLFKRLLIQRICEMCGIELSTKLDSKFNSDPEWFNQENPVPELHIIRVHPMIKTTNTVPFMEGLLLLHSGGDDKSFTSNKAVVDRSWSMKGAAKKFKEALETSPGGRSEILALSRVQYLRAQSGLPLDSSIRLLDRAQHTMEYLLKMFPNDPVAFVLYADVVHLSGRLRNNAKILQLAVTHYLQHLSANANDAHAVFQCGSALLTLYYLQGKNPDTLKSALKYAARSVEMSPHDGEAWALLARTMAVKTTLDSDPAMFAVCDDAFSRTFLYMQEHENSDVMYRWATYVLHKAIAFDNLDLLLVATMKLKAAVEKQAKPEYFTVIRSCIHTIREKIKAEEIGDQRWSQTTMGMIGSWLKVLKQAMKSLDQRCKVISWDDLELVQPLSSSEFHFLYQARWSDYTSAPDARTPAPTPSSGTTPAITPAATPLSARSAEMARLSSLSNVPQFKRTLSTSAASAVSKEQPPLTPSTQSKQQEGSDGDSAEGHELLHGSMSQSLLRKFRSQKKIMRQVCIKLIPRRIALASDQERFANEMRVMQSFENPIESILHFYGRTYSDDHEGMVFEYFPGLPALERISNATSTLPPSAPVDDRYRLKWQFITRIALQVAQGLEYIHKSSVLWVDTSSRNVLVDENGNARVANFEQAKIVSSDDPMGEFNFRAELIDFGGLLWELASGEYRPEGLRINALPINKDWPEEYTLAIKMCNLTDIDSSGSMTDVVEQLTVAAMHFFKREERYPSVAN